jgi:hypothetical protein
VFRTPALLANAVSLHGLLGAAHPPRGTIFAVTWALLSVANFLELRKAEVRTFSLPRTSVNRLPGCLKMDSADG